MFRLALSCNIELLHFIEFFIKLLGEFGLKRVESCDYQH